MRAHAVARVSLLLCIAGGSVGAQATSALAGTKIQLSGYIRHAESREVVRYALVSADGDSVQLESGWLASAPD